MSGHPYWLFSITPEKVQAALVLFQNNRYRLTTLGPELAWTDEANFISQFDKSLSSAAESAQLNPETEPSDVSFVLPSFWVGLDGKIISDKFQLVESLCRKLKLKPMGFLSHDEAVVEEANLKDGLPSSFVLIQFDSHKFTLSLAYLGKIKDRIQKDFSSGFHSSIVENALLEIKTDSALPPQILMFGQVGDDILAQMSNYPWIGKRNIETFLHLPDIKIISNQEIFEIYCRIISTQLITSTTPSAPLTINDTEADNPLTDTEADTVEEKFDPSLDHSLKLEEVPASSLGFVDNVPKPEPLEPTLPPPDPEPILQTQPVLPVFSADDFNQEVLIDSQNDNKSPRLKINLPKLSINFRPLLIILAASPLLILILILLTSAQITLFITPLKFNKQIPVILDTSLTSFDASTSKIPVNKQTFDVTVSESAPTTGKKTVGDKAKGEIVIYNKQSKPQNLPQGTVLQFDSKKFELTTAVTVAASSADLDQGVITLGQTKAVAIALDIGPEHNLPSGTQLAFKDYSDSQIIAKTKEAFSGGTKKEISAVSSEDKANLEKIIDNKIRSAVDDKVKSGLDNISGALRDTIKTSKNKIDYSREVGEEADQLTATVNATVSVLVLPPQSYQPILDKFLQSEPDYASVEVKAADYNISFASNKSDANTATGNLSIQGQSLPKIDIPKLISEITGKTHDSAIKTITSISPRIYKYKIDQNISLMGKFSLLPLSKDKIKIEIKSESL